MEYVSSFRVAAKIASIFDLVLSVLCALISFIVILAIFNMEKQPEQEGSKNTTNPHAQAIVLALTIIFCVYSLLHIWAATRLLRAAAQDADPAFALRGTKIWQGFNVFFIILVIVGCVLRPTAIGIYILLVLRLIFLLVVLLFMRDLKEAVN